MSAAKPFENPNNNSPIRKQLAKRIINYYDQLAQSRELDRSRSASKEREKSRSKSKERLNSSSRMNSKSSLGGSTANDQPKETYEDMEHRKIKLQKLKELMKNELDRAEADGALDPDYDTLEELHPGAPTFAQDQFDRHKLEDHHHVNLKVFLMEKVDTFDKIPDEVGEIENEEDVVGPDGKLYHIVTKKTITKSNKADENCFDFHQRKAKEIRRLQYAAGVGKGKPKPAAIFYPVWVVVSGKPEPGKLGSENNEIKLNKNKDTLIVNIDDYVIVKPEGARGQFQRFEGYIKKPEDSDGVCDFVVEAANGKRHPILMSYSEPKVEPPPPAPIPEVKELKPAKEVAQEKPAAVVQRAPERPKFRNVPGTNSTIKNPFDGDKKLGRAKAQLAGKDLGTGKKIEFAKAILLDSNNELAVVLLKILNPQECIIKKADQTQADEEILREETADMGDGMMARRLILKKKPGDNSPFEREVYLYANSFFLQPLRIFDNEPIEAECENMQDYKGRTEWKKDGKNPEDEKLYINFKDPLGRKDMVRIEFDEAYGLNDIANKMGHLADLAKKRHDDWLLTLKKKRRILELDELRFDVVDHKGRKIKVLIKNDSDNEDFSDSEDENGDLPLENAYYHLMVEDNKVMPFKRRSKEDRAKQQESIWRKKIKETEEVSKYSVKIEPGHISKRKEDTAEEDRKLVEKKIREDLAEIAHSLGIKFPNEKMFDSFVQFMSGLPAEVDERKAALQYKSMMDMINATQ